MYVRAVAAMSWPDIRHTFTMAKVGGKFPGEKKVETLWTVCLQKVDSKHAKTGFQGKKVDSKHAKTEFQGKKVDSTT